MDISTRLAQFSRIGKTTLKRLNNLGLFTVHDLLYHFPFRYEDYRQIMPIKQLIEGQMVTVRGRVELIGNRRAHRRRMTITEALISDETGSLRIVWFNQPYITKGLAIGDEVYVSGKVKTDMIGPELTNPSYEKITNETTNTARMVPVYPTTEGLTQKQIRSLIKQALPVADKVGDWVPEELLTEYDLVPLKDALHGIHFPVDDQDLDNAEKRLSFDEMFTVQLQVELNKLNRQVVHAPRIAFMEAEIKTFVSRLSFTLTKAQKIAAWEIIKDTGLDKPMNRLLSGDVGSGKTVVAALALYNTALNGYQAAIMAPTEILASQHFESLKKLLPDVPVGLFTRTQHFIHQSGKEEKYTKKKMIEAVATGKVAVIIGTHALLTEGVAFRQLGLTIVDEQHRFGVAQRQVIKEKGKGVHFLSMTATPIPRSLALMLYGDLDISVINEMPAGRKIIKTRVVDATNRVKAYQFIREQIQQGRQAFVVCPLIEEDPSAMTEKKSVMTEYEKLSKEIFPDLKVAYLHGKMKPTEKEAIMEDFKNNKTNILVSTSVIEVGVNIPNATVMMIEGADRFGLAQLHQFRGRVGRSDYQSYCLLFTDSGSAKTKERLGYFEKHHDGFSLAEKDLELRGPGELYGTLQSGEVDLKLAKLTDQETLKQSRDAAKNVAPLLEKYPHLKDHLKTLKKGVHLE